MKAPARGRQGESRSRGPWEEGYRGGEETKADTGKGEGANGEKGAKATKDEQQGNTAVADLMDLGKIKTKTPNMAKWWFRGVHQIVAWVGSARRGQGTGQARGKGKGKGKGKHR